MRILQLRFKNINSLAGCHELDFAQPEFAETGIFAITGKTGSGKSSILDAISLALYGKTPRVDITSSSNDVMTRGERDCFSEIVFESKGRKWKASWKQERSKTGNLKQIERCVADENDIIIADKASEAGRKVVEILGLNFEQFTKVILLAQGSFAAFLQADKSEKGELLEQITGTKIYGEISKKAYERAKLESQKLERINIEIGAIKILGDEDMRKLESEIADFGEQKKKIDDRLQAIEQIIEKSKALNLALEDIKASEGKIKSLQSELAANAQSFGKAEKELKAKAELQAAKNRELEDKKAQAAKILNGKEINYCHGEKEKIVVFGKEVNNLIGHIGEIISGKAKMEEAAKIIAENSAKEKELAAKIESKKKNREDIEKHISLLQENIKFAEKIRSLSEHRKALEDGKECPLCGSAEHPFAKGNIPQLGEKENELKDKTKQLKDLREEILGEERMLEKLKSDRSNAQGNKSEIERKIEECRSKTQKILAEIGQMEISEDEACINRLALIRKQKLEEYKKIDDAIKRAIDAENAIALLRDGEIPKINSEIEAIKNEEKALQIKAAELQTSMRDKHEQIASQKAKIDSLEKDNMASEFAGKSLEELQAERKEKKACSDDFSQKIGASRQALESNAQNSEKHKQKLAEKEAQQASLDKWKRLDNLIGSADGKKFRNYAQALTFENLISIANGQLQKMSERYILKRVGDLSSPFDLAVIDKFQNCEERTAQNLSGGEKFIASLALALGLSNMASRNIRIDTMFIDEGFGTLDSDYLDVALTALSGLQSEGKLIGVISHLSELKERIATHITVTPIGGGRSRINNYYINNSIL